MVLALLFATTLYMQVCCCMLVTSLFVFFQFINIWVVGVTTGAWFCGRMINVMREVAAKCVTSVVWGGGGVGGV